MRAVVTQIRVCAVRELFCKPKNWTNKLTKHVHSHNNQILKSRKVRVIVLKVRPVVHQREVLHPRR